MKVYNYDNLGIFTSEENAALSPLEKNVYLIPANATTIKPPNATEKQVPVFDGQKWNLVDDNRGQIYYHKITRDQFLVTTLTLPENISEYTSVVPSDSPFIVFDDESESWVEDLVAKNIFEMNQLKEQKIQELKEDALTKGWDSLSNVQKKIVLGLAYTQDELFAE